MGPDSGPEMAAAGQLSVQVCYATATREILLNVTVGEGSTIEQAINASGILQAVPEIDLATHPVGVFGKKKTLDGLLRGGDRVEIYRPLVADPKESRRRRAEKKNPAA